MSGKKKIEEDYKKFETAIDKIAKEEMRKIHDKTIRTKVEAEEIGESVEQTLTEDTVSRKKKKS